MSFLKLFFILMSFFIIGFVVLLKNNISSYTISSEIYKCLQATLNSLSPSKKTFGNLCIPKCTVCWILIATLKEPICILHSLQLRVFKNAHKELTYVESHDCVDRCRTVS